MFVAALACMMMAGSISALAANPNEVFYTYTGENFSRACCYSWNDTVSITEPASVTPVVVTWSTEYLTTGFFLVGLSVNKGACTAFGPRTISPSLQGSRVDTRSIQWIVPSSVLVRGKNTFLVCGGADSGYTGPIELGIRSFAARLSN